MRQQHPQIAVDEHVMLGNALKDTHDVLERMLTISPASSQHGRDILRTLEAIERLQYSMDELLYSRVVGRDPRGIARLVYYGAEHLTLHSYDPHEVERDAFVHWQREIGVHRHSTSVDRS